MKFSEYLRDDDDLNQRWPKYRVFLTTEQLAQRWQMGESTLNHWRRADCGPNFTRIGNRVLYRLADVEQYERANTTILGDS